MLKTEDIGDQSRQQHLKVVAYTLCLQHLCILDKTTETVSVHSIQNFLKNGDPLI